MNDNSLTSWMVGVGGGLLVAAALAAFKMFDRNVTSALKELKGDTQTNHAEVLRRLEEVSQRVGEHSSQLAVVHHQLGQHDQELKDVRTRQDALATYWRNRFGDKP